MPDFDAVAPFYDELMRAVPYGMWVEYYKLLLAHQGVRPRSLLDVCCGTGTIAQRLAGEGYRVAGFDISPEMIAEAGRKAQGKGLDVRYEVADAATVNLGEKFDAAFSFFDSLNYIVEPDRLRASIRRVAEHLEPGGSFVFDINTAYAFDARLFDQRQMHPAARLRYQWRGDWDPESRLIHVHMKFWRKGREIEKVHVQRAYSDEEIRSMLADAGFREVLCFHSYSLDPPRPKSDRLHYAALLG